MEKIYMDSKGKQPKKQTFLNQLFNDKGSMVALVIVAFVGVLGLMVFGLNQISFAANTAGQLPNSFVSKQGDENVMRLIGTAGYMDNGTFKTTDPDKIQQGVLPVLGFYTDGDIPIFCIEYNIGYEVGRTYTKGGEIKDYGLIYLMSQIYPNKPFKDTDGEELDENIQVWLTQSAIWSYLYESGDTQNSKFVDWNDKVKLVFKLYNNDGDDVIATDGTKTLYQAFGIDTVISKAKEVKNNVKDLTAFLTVSKASENISVTNDNKYYQTGEISVIGSTKAEFISKYNGYSVELSNAPEGTFLVDEKGNKYDDLSKMSPTDKFYVRVPIKNVNDKNKKFGLSIKGNFEMYGANMYVSDTKQKVANVKLINQIINKNLDVNLDYTPEVPDTGMGVAQTIYFMGLILLLSGVGIVYANAKPKTNE